MSSKLVGKLKDKHLLLCFDAFGTLFKPRTSIATTYAKTARQYGIKDVDEEALAVSFKKAFKFTSKGFPNYGKATGLKPELWWARVIRASFKPVTSTYIPDVMIHDLMKQFSSNLAYRLLDDVLPFFYFLRNMKGQPRTELPQLEWPWKSTTVGIITNSDPRVPTILRSLGIGVQRDTAENKKKRRSDISFVTMSYDAEVEKPDTRIFKAARTAFGQLPASSGISDADIVKVHVGDDMKKDVFGAMDAGWDAIFLDREDKFRDEWDRLGAEKTVLSISTEGREIAVIKSLSALKLWDPSPKL